jgi:hypothetical protein
MDSEVATGVSIQKVRASCLQLWWQLRSSDRLLQGKSDPKLPADGACSAWLSALADTRPTLSELQRRSADGSGDTPLSVAEGLHLLRMQRRAEIKAANASSGKE